MTSSPSSAPLLLLLLCGTLVACPPGRASDDDDAADDDDSAVGDDDDATGDDDDATGDDDDDDATGDDDDDTPADGVLGTLPCDEEVVDIWTVAALAGDSVRISVDTIGAGSAFNPASSAFQGADVNTAPYLGAGDDEGDCTFPVPDFGCPQYEVTPSADGAIGILVENYGCIDESAVAEYLLGVSVNGVDQLASLVGDDVKLGADDIPPPMD